jgi:hypothetical protein
LCDSILREVVIFVAKGLLPLLQPMTVEPNERLCRQGEECEEMYVIINGVMTGYSHLQGADPEVDEPIVSRKLTKGDSINVLCVLEIWHKVNRSRRKSGLCSASCVGRPSQVVCSQCVETVGSGLSTAETYAVKADEFVALFQSDIDLKNLASMRLREVKKFEFTPADDAPTSLGKPL